MSSMSNVFSFLIATDCHLGFEESDHIIGDDSFITFEEILIKAVEQDVDMILLGGDLFHHNNPSQKCMNKCMELLRRYTLGDKPVFFELLCNASEVLSNSVSQTTNYLDENINVSIPVFSIHGNHDDPSGLGQFSALDTLSSAGLVNYFGKWTDLNEVIIKPILLRKGVTKIALYGLSHIKDDRLCRLFMSEKVKFVRPEIDPDDWFNIFVLHQNRVDRGPKRFISESYIPDFIDLVIWGHEHDCEIEPHRNLEKGFYIIQPGSSCPTSLSEGEAIQKYIAVLKVYEKKMKIEPLKLNTTRPFVWRTESLWDVVVTSDNREKKSEEIKTHCVQVVEEMIREAQTLVTGHTKQPKLPLIRLRCEYDDETQLFNIVKFGQIFRGRVANPNGEIVRLKRSFGRKGIKKEKPEDLERLNELYKDNMEESYNFTTCVNHIVKDYFTNHEEARMMVLRVNEMGAAVEKFIDKDNVFAIEEFIDERFEKIMKELKNVKADQIDLKQVFEQLRNEDEKMELQEEEDLNKKLEKYRPKKSKDDNEENSEANNSDPEEKIDEESDDEFFGKKQSSKTSNKKMASSDSDTDEYNAKTETQTARKKNDSCSEDSDRDMFGRSSKGGNRKTTEKEPPKPRGRGRGRGGGRGRGRATETRKQSPRSSQSTRGRTKPLLNFGNSVMYEDDSD